MAENNATNNIRTNADESELVITRIFDAPRELVFKAWNRFSKMSADHLSATFAALADPVRAAWVAFFSTAMRSPKDENFWGKGIHGLI